MNDLAKQMAPIRDTIARTREKVEQIERLLVTATEAERMEFTSAAEGAVEQARRLLAELNGNAGELPKPTPASPKLPCDCAECCGCKTLEEANAWLLANPGKAVSHAKANTMRLIGRESLGDTIDRTLPPGFEVRKFTHGWYPCCDFMDGMCRVYISGDKTWTTSRDYWTGDCGYLTESAAYADKARWLKAAGVDWPEVTGPHEDGNYDIRTSTHWWNGDEWETRDAQSDKIGFFRSPRKNAVCALPAARRAWVEMQKEAAR